MRRHSCLTRTAQRISRHCMKKLRIAILFLALNVFYFESALAEAITEESPFLWAGKIYADPASGITTEVRNRYGDLPFKYPNKASCIATNNVEGTAQLENLIWDDLHTTSEVEVCLFRVLAALKDQEKITNWMLKRGWAKPFVTDSTSTGHLFGATGQVTQLSFYWDAARLGALYGDSAERRKFLRRNLGATATVTIDSTKGVLRLIFRNEPKFQM